MVGLIRPGSRRKAGRGDGRDKRVRGTDALRFADDDDRMDENADNAENTETPAMPAGVAVGGRACAFSGHVWRRLT